MQDPVVSKYLPSKEQLSGKLPERDFFFGILCTLKNQYMKDVIAFAHEKRFKVPEEDQKKSAILISDSWFAELQKHPYYSRKNSSLIVIGKPGTGVFLLKESAKLYKAQKNRSSFALAKRMASEDHKMDGASENRGAGEKRMKGPDGKPVSIPDGLMMMNKGGK